MRAMIDGNDRARFRALCEETARNGRGAAGIGTLGEKTLHAVLKRYAEPDESRHEIRIGGFVADIFNDDGITEIQTRDFNKLRKKLEAFLAFTCVTLVYPVAAVKRVFWIDAGTGEITGGRLSPRKGTPGQAFFELYRIKPLLVHPNLRLRIVMLDIHEYKNLDGWSDDRKKGSSRYERIPMDIVDEVTVGGPADYARLLPEGLPGLFTAKDYKAASGLSAGNAGRAVNILCAVGCLERTGKEGRAFRYRVAGNAALNAEEGAAHAQR